jgi:hypothetical protein
MLSQITHPMTANLYGKITKTSDRGTHKHNTTGISNNLKCDTNRNVVQEPLPVIAAE